MHLFLFPVIVLIASDISGVVSSLPLIISFSHFHQKLENYILFCWCYIHKIKITINITNSTTIE